ncbi:glycosyltransferase family 39 protein [Synechococcus sp. CS-1325]|uniref:ArnT family glycosyltransferase n=1 Tax=unclassified Synechococcus TaxID=2626047 RepID=UPI0021A32868|nr:MULTISPECIES: glycosyltransferase family 39 protein [unclassified Synechococcus]MCT0198771.1 glycosyltransferase family 39 protein [Synechococcus sp. CS-1325]MCT0212888.1 glycosyltransferase family 39 protein [Synechococcus sp. CS-1326]MCT0233092.1 glycosyltransferase family 39 protein [Synechococcus sp. CS-1327]
MPSARPPAAHRPRPAHGPVLLACLLVGTACFLWQLGDTGLVDETPPRFAEAARTMAESGDWLTPWVNGLPRYDKPPLVYWLMALGYSLPGQESWNPLGTWAARLPSGLASIGVMLALADTLLRWPQPSPGDPPPPPSSRTAALTALTAALAFSLSPLVLLWSRIAVSDALFSGCLAVALLLFWRTWAEPQQFWWPGWAVLGLAVLSKGPVALALAGLTLLGFGWRQQALLPLWRRLRPLPGLALTLAVSGPWYGAMLLVEGRPFWDSFFGYHNFQRFTSVVNEHLQPWWYFLPVLVVASLPFTPLLGLGLVRGLMATTTRSLPPSSSLRSFAACWLLAVLLLFTLAATKLPSYWLPATPAAGLLIALAAQDGVARGGRSQAKAAPDRWFQRAQGLTVALSGLLAAALWASPAWIPLIDDPEMPTLPGELLASGYVLRAALCFSLATLAGAWFWLRTRTPGPGWLLGLQLPLVAFQLLAVLPMWQLGDGVRGRPVRAMAAAAAQLARPGEKLAMVGILKPSLHYYSRRVVLYEGTTADGLANLSDRLRSERRRNLEPSSSMAAPTVLMVIDAATAALPHWRSLKGAPLFSSGLYSLWRVERGRLDQQASSLVRTGKARVSWRDPRPERY